MVPMSHSIKQKSGFIQPLYTVTSSVHLKKENMMKALLNNSSFEGENICLRNKQLINLNNTMELPRLK